MERWDSITLVHMQGRYLKTIQCWVVCIWFCGSSLCKYDPVFTRCVENISGKICSSKTMTVMMMVSSIRRKANWERCICKCHTFSEFHSPRRRFCFFYSWLCFLPSFPCSWNTIPTSFSKVGQKRKRKKRRINVKILIKIEFLTF